MNTPQTRRLTILNADEIEAIFGLPQFTEDERQMHFALNPSESEIVSAARTITAAVHLTLQIGYFKATQSTERVWALFPLESQPRNEA